MSQRPSRADRFWASLPRILSARRQGSAIGHLVEVLGAALDRLDADLEAVMRDHWLELASGELLGDELPSPLERLGTALGVPREGWEDNERYRRRLRATAPVLGGGIGTPRVVLSLAVAALDAELCPRLARNRDTTTGWALSPGAVASCPVQPCHRGAGICPMARARLARLDLTDNPPEQREVHFAATAAGQRFRVRSQSLEADRPELELRAGAGAIEFPVIENLATNELLLFAGTLQPGEILAGPGRVWSQARPRHSTARCRCSTIHGSLARPTARRRSRARNSICTSGCIICAAMYSMARALPRVAIRAGVLRVSSRIAGPQRFAPEKTRGAFALWPGPI